MIGQIVRWRKVVLNITRVGPERDPFFSLYYWWNRGMVDLILAIYEIGNWIIRIKYYSNSFKGVFFFFFFLFSFLFAFDYSIIVHLSHLIRGYQIFITFSVFD